MSRFQKGQSVRLTGFQLPGFDGGSKVGSKSEKSIQVDTKVKSMIVKASTSLGVVKLSLQNAVSAQKSLTKEKVLIGKKITTGKTTGEKRLDLLVNHLSETEPAYFVLFKSDKNCMFVMFVPDKAETLSKFPYSMFKSTTKDVISDLVEDVEFEDFQVNDIAMLNYAEYHRRATVEPPKTILELNREEHDKAEIGGGYGFLGNNRQSIRLPGLDGRDGGYKLALQNIRNSTRMNKESPRLRRTIPAGSTEPPAGAFILPSPSKPNSQPKVGAENAFRFKPPTKEELDRKKKHNSLASAMDKSVVISFGKDTPTPEPKKFNEEEITGILGSSRDVTKESSKSENIEAVLGSNRLLSSQSISKSPSQNKGKIDNFLARVEKKKKEDQPRRIKSSSSQHLQRASSRVSRISHSSRNSRVSKKSRNSANLNPGVRTSNRLSTSSRNSKKSKNSRISRRSKSGKQITREATDSKRVLSRDIPDEELKSILGTSATASKRMDKIPAQVPSVSSAEEDSSASESEDETPKEVVQPPMKTASQVSKPTLKKEKTIPELNLYEKQEAEVMVPQKKVSRQESNVSGKIGIFNRLARKGGNLIRKLSFTKTTPVKLSPEDLPDEDGELTYEEIRKMQTKGEYGKYAPREMEMYMSSKEFYKLFKMDKASYSKLPAWRKKRLKKKFQLL
eukprot:maker-scaffold_26-snap-gene-1.1-mRNA-1 protein AED:0.03 eAED:0.03 QI:229/1/1/1/0.5/0.33/3/127/676